MSTNEAAPPQPPAPMQWCGVEHPHGVHRWAELRDATERECPGSTGRVSVGACFDRPFEATEGIPVPPVCRLAAGHLGAHEDSDSGAQWAPLLTVRDRTRTEHQ